MRTWAPRTPQHPRETPIRLDPRSPLVLDTVEVGRRPGTMRRVERSVPAPDLLGTDVARVVAGSPVVLTLRLEAVMEGVLVSGPARAQWTAECVRCLDRIERPVEVDLQELFSYPGRVPTEVEDEEEQLELQGDLLDLEPVLRDAVVLALPFQPVCRDDCPGLCPECGARLADDPDHHHDVADPRWSALQGLAVPADPDDERES